jgi:hypothetical protein
MMMMMMMTMMMTMMTMMFFDDDNGADDEGNDGNDDGVNDAQVQSLHEVCAGHEGARALHHVTEAEVTVRRRCLRQVPATKNHLPPGFKTTGGDNGDRPRPAPHKTEDAQDARGTAATTRESAHAQATHARTHPTHARNATQRNAAQRSATQRNAAQRSATQRSAAQRNATQRNAAKHKRTATRRKTHSHGIGEGRALAGGGVLVAAAEIGPHVHDLVEAVCHGQIAVPVMIILFRRTREAYRRGCTHALSWLLQVLHCHGCCQWRESRCVHADTHSSEHVMMAPALIIGLCGTAGRGLNVALASADIVLSRSRSAWLAR